VLGLWTVLCPAELLPKLLARFAPTAPADEAARLLAAADVLHLAIRAAADHPALAPALKPWWSPLTAALLATAQRAPDDGATGTGRTPEAASAWAVLTTLAQAHPAVLVPHAGDVVTALSGRGLAFPDLDVRRGAAGRAEPSVEGVAAPCS